MPTKGNPKVGFRLSPEEIQALRALAAGRPISDVIRERLRGSEGLIPAIPLDLIQLDQELTRIEQEARGLVYRQQEFVALARTPEETLRAWEREIAQAKAVDPKDTVAYSQAQQVLKDLEPRVSHLRALQAQAEPIVVQKAKELKRERDLDPLADVPGGSLSVVIAELVEAAENVEAIRKRFEFVPDTEEAQSAIAAAERRLQDAQEKLEKLIGLYTQALELRRQRAAEREKEKAAEKERARKALRPIAQELFETRLELKQALEALRRDWSTHPGVKQAILLAEKLHDLRAQFYGALGKAGERDERAPVPRPSAAVVEMLRVLRARFPEDPSTLNENDLKILRWILDAVAGLDENSVPNINPLPPTIKLERPQFPAARR